MKLRMSLTNFDSNDNILYNREFLKTELKWLFLGSKYPSEILFIPYAYDGNYYNTYIQQVKDIFDDLRIRTKLITEGDPDTLISKASGIVIGGGDLAKLLGGIVMHLNALKRTIQNGIPYLGWNEGSVAASPTYIVPSIVPVSNVCIHAINIQMYCHYVDTTPNRYEIQSFLLNHKNDQPPIGEVICMKDTPGSTGIRLEDDGSGIINRAIPNTPSPIDFILVNGQLAVQ